MMARSSATIPIFSVSSVESREYPRTEIGPPYQPAKRNSGADQTTASRPPETQDFGPCSRASSGAV